jgi:hypothetical protein
VILFAPMASVVNILNWSCGVLGDILLLFLLVLVFRNKVYGQLKFFVFYLLFASARTLAIESYWATPTSINDRSYYPYFYSFWITAFVLSFLRLFITLEICERVLRKYPAIRVLVWRIMASLAVVLFTWTLYFGIRNFGHVPRFILTFQQTTDVSFALLLLTLMGIGVYYRMRIPALYRVILIGSCVYSAVQIVDSELGRHTVYLPNSPFDLAQRLAYNLMLAIWTWAVWRWGKESTSSPEIVSQATYDELSPQIHDRLKELNDKLSDLTGKRRR